MYQTFFGGSVRKLSVDDLALKVFLLLGFLVFSFFSLFNGILNFEGVGWVAWIALAWFAILVFYSSLSERAYWKAAPLVILATPNALNDFLPSYPMSNELGAPLFSFFTHLDFYFLWGVFLYCNFQKRVSLLALIVFSLFLFFAVFVFWGALWRNDLEVAMVGGFQLRYVFWMFLLFFFAEPARYDREVLTSLVISLFFIIVESFSFSFSKDLDRLTSGNYGVNTLGHLMAAGAVCVLGFKSSGLSFLGRCLIFCFLIFIVILTGTRFSLVALVGSLCVFWVIWKGNFWWIFVALFFSCFAAFLFFCFTPLGVSMWVGLKIVMADFSSPEYITITPESSSMVTRLNLWWASWSMLSDYPWLGVGPGGWAYSKEDFGIFYYGVLDPHQDLINYLVSYGFLGGGLFYVAIFIFPLLRALNKWPVSYPWAGLLLVFLIAGLTNAVTWKHQVAALCYFSAFLIFFLRDKGLRG